MKRRIALLLGLLILVAAFAVACEQQPPEESSQPEVSETPESKPEPIDAYHDAEGNYVATLSGNTYGSREITFLACGVNPTYNSEILYNDYTSDTASSEPLPEVINKAQGDRVDYVEAQLDVKISELFVYEKRRPGGDMATRIRNDNLSFTAEYQIVIPCLYDGATLAQEGQFIDLNSIAGLDLKAPWWDQVFNKENTIGGQLYFTIGDIGTINKSGTAALTFNKALYLRNKLDEKYGGLPYDLVRNKKWTLDTVLAMTKEISQDKNEDGSITYEDVYGWGGQLDDMWSLFYGSGSKIATTETADGYPELTMFTERSSRVMEKMQSLVQDKAHYVSANDYFGVAQWPSVLLKNNFIAGDSLFFNGSMATPIELGEMEDAFGMVPIPMGDDTQEDYYSLVNPWTSTCFAIPISVEDADLPMMADFLNAMGAASANLTAPAYLKQCLEYMKVRDDDTVDMIENYILPGRGCDIGMIYAWGGLDGLLHTMASQPVGSFYSNYETKESAAKNAMTETVNYFK
ncbi:MAG: hypothetical protein ILO68_06880, partial [Clostridia bacterium]|nr:hypothetical protein [Clostridia bacterium]